MSETRVPGTFVKGAFTGGLVRPKASRRLRPSPVPGRPGHP